VFSLLDAPTRLAEQNENAGDRAEFDQKASALWAAAL
jgi:hypothetical protein